MTQHRPLSSRDDRDLRIRTERSAVLGDAAMCCVTFPEEFRRVQAHYPIVFQRDAGRSRFNALALTGFQDGENLFLTEAGWDAHYIPLAMNIQPFLVGRSAEPGGASQVHIDMGHPRVGGEEGLRVFDDEGRPTPFLEAMNDRLGELQAGYENSGSYLDALVRHDLLEPFALDVTLKDGSQNRLVGFHAINEERLRDLDTGTLAELHAAGHLMPTFMAVASLSHFNDLVARKNARLKDV